VFSSVVANPVNVVLGNGCSISGYLLTTGGLPVPNVGIKFNMYDPLEDMVWQKDATTDATGKFIIALTSTDLYTAGDYDWWLVFGGATVGSIKYISAGSNEATIIVRGACDDGIDKSLCASPGYVCNPITHPTTCEQGVQYTCTKTKDCTYCAVASGPCGGSEPKALAMTFVSGYEPPVEVTKGSAINIAVLLTDVDDSSILTNVAVAVDHYDADTDSWVTVATMEAGNTDCNCYPFALATSAYAAGLHSFRARSVSDVYNEVIINFDTEITVTSVCTEGAEKCVDGYYAVCTDNAWVISTDECDEETSSTGKYLMVAGVLGVAGIALIAFTRRR
jgi:hypothetical protein